MNQSEPTNNKNNFLIKNQRHVYASLNKTISGKLLLNTLRKNMKQTKKITIQISSKLSKKSVFDFKDSKQLFRFSLRIKKRDVYQSFSRTNYRSFESLSGRHIRDTRDDRTSFSEDSFFRDDQLDNLLLNRGDGFDFHQQNKEDNEEQKWIFEQIFTNYKSRFKEKNEIQTRKVEDEYSIVLKYCKEHVTNT